MNSDSVTINGEVYVKQQTGSRAVVVVDRGWIFAGDVTTENGRIKISRAVHVLGWEEIGFAGIIDDPKNKKIHIKKLASIVDMPADAEIFRVPVAADWGL